VPSLAWSYGSWIYNYLCNLFLSPLMLQIRILLGARCTTLYDSLLVTCDRSMVFSGFLHHNITEILLKVALNTIKPTKKSRRKEALFINNKIHCCITTEQLARWNKIMLKIITPKLYCSYLNNSFYSRRLWKESLKQWWSTIPPISTKWTTPSHLN